MDFAICWYDWTLTVLSKWRIFFSILPQFTVKVVICKCIVLTSFCCCYLGSTWNTLLQCQYYFRVLPYWMFSHILKVFGYFFLFFVQQRSIFCYLLIGVISVCASLWDVSDIWLSYWIFFLLLYRLVNLVCNTFEGNMILYLHIFLILKIWLVCLYMMSVVYWFKLTFCVKLFYYILSIVKMLKIKTQCN